MEAMLALAVVGLFVWVVSLSSRLTDLQLAIRRQAERIGVLEALRQPPVGAPVARTAAPEPAVAPSPTVGIDHPSPEIETAPPAARAAATPSTMPAASAWTDPIASSDPPWDFPSLSGGQLLSIAGGAFVFIGAATFVTMAISNGWISPLVQILLGYVFGASMFAIGAVASSRFGDSASLIAAGVGTGVVQLVNVAGVQHYGVIPVGAGLVIAIAAGGAAVAWALRYDSQPLAGFGIATALAGPVLVDAPASWSTLILLGVALVCTVVVVVRRGWAWLAVVSLAVTALQVADWSTASATADVARVIVILGWWTLHAGAALGFDVRHGDGRLRTSSATLAFASSGATSLLLLDANLVHQEAALVVLAALHFCAAAGLAYRCGERCLIFATWMGVTGTGVLAIAIATGLDGPARVPFWALESVALLGVRLFYRDVRAGAGALVLGAIAGGAALAGASPDMLVTGTGDVPATLVALLPIVAGAAASLALATLFERGALAVEFEAGTEHLTERDLGRLLIALLCASASYLAMILGATWGDDLGRAFAMGLVAAVAIATVRVRHRLTLEVAAASTAALTALLVVGSLCTADQLAYGAERLDTSVEGGMIVVALACEALLLRRSNAEPDACERAVGWALGAMLAFISSIVVVTMLTPDPALRVLAQAAQLALSTYWALLGLGMVAVGLAQRHVNVHRVGAGALGMSAAKVLLLDTQNLEAAYRVGVFVGVGLALLVGGFAYLRAADR